MKEYIISRAHDADIKFVGEELFSAIGPFSASLYRTKAGNYVAVRILASSLMSDQDLAKQVEIVMENHPPGTKKTKAFSKEAAKKLIEFFGMSDFAMDLYNKINLDAGTLVSIVKSKSKSRLMVFSVYKSQFIGYMSFGRPYILEIQTCIHDGWIAVSEINNSLDRDYLYYLMMTSASQTYFSNNAAGSGVQNLNADIIKLLPVAYPNKKEQQKIADCLSSLDELITAETKIINIINIYINVIKNAVVNH